MRSLGIALSLCLTLSLASLSLAAEILLPHGRTAFQTNEPIDISVVRTADANLAAGTLALTLGAGQTSEGALEPSAPFVYKDSFVYRLTLRSTRGGRAADGRDVGAFVEIALDVAPRQPPAGP